MCISQTFGDFGISKVSDCNIVLIKVFFQAGRMNLTLFLAGCVMLKTELYT
jgi:hypothetical protein